MAQQDATLEQPATAKTRAAGTTSGRRAALDNAEPPISNEAVNGALNPDVLPVRGATFVVDPYPGMDDGDYIILRFDQGGPNEATADFDVSSNWVGKPISLIIPKAKVQAALGTDVDVDYVVEPGNGGTIINSDPLPLFVGVREEVKLKAPSVDEADGDHLDPKYIEFGVRVRIPVYDGMAIGDEIHLFWGGAGDPGYYTDKITVRAVREITFPIPPENLEPHLDKKVQIRYDVLRDGPTRPSNVFTLRIGDVEDDDLLERPVVVEATGGVINPDLVPSGAQALIGPYTGIEDGDYVHVVWGGGPPTGAEWGIDITRKYLTKPYPIRIPANKIASFIDRTVEFYYEKELPDATWQPSKRLTLEVKRESAKAAPPSVPASSNGQVDPRDIDPSTGLEVIVPPYVGMRQGDRIVVYWKSEIELGDFTSDPYFVKSTDPDKPVSFHVPLAIVVVSSKKGIDVHYEVTRGGAPIVQGSALELTVRQVELPQATIEEAKGDKLNPDDCPNGAHVELGASAKFRASDQVIFYWRGQPGDGTFSRTVTVKPEEAGGSLEIVVPLTAVQVNVNHSVSLEYMVKRTNGAPDEIAPPAVFDVISMPGSGELVVFGARNNSSIYRSSSVSQYLSAFQKTTLQNLNAQWRYEDESDWTLAHSFKDTRPWMPLKVRSQDDSVTLNPVNITGSGTDSATRGASALVAHLNRGNVIGWGVVAHGGSVPPTIITYDDVVEVSATQSAFAVRRTNGRIAVWGNTAQGGALPNGFSVTDVVRIIGNSVAFALVRANGQVLAWGTAASGGDVPADVAGLTDIRSVWATGTAFAALRDNGAVVAWGAPATGVSAAIVPPEIAALTDVAEVRGNFTAFTALRKNKTVVAWGAAADGGEVPANIAVRAEILELASASARAFAVRTEGKQVLAWGNAAHGAAVPAEIEALTDIEEVTATWGAFCARRSNGSVVAWGNVTQGGTVPLDIAVLNDIVQVTGTGGAFAALRKNGTVVAWGNPELGGNTATVASLLVDVRALYANTEVFVAVLATGGVVTWGMPAGGGDSASVKPILDTALTYEATAVVRGRALAALHL
ncbi:RCC1 domain-containing protein [Burkholderia ubonensis]|uniref:RCC1 domain-containing protein n=1 Tax=Burkholderia ubonensis TaxID=101571 RepID=UPI000AA2BE56|nr:hypothetical protein [Burkholderia ubonensis]